MNSVAGHHNHHQAPQRGCLRRTFSLKNFVPRRYADKQSPFVESQFELSSWLSWLKRRSHTSLYDLLDQTSKAASLVT